MFDTDKPIKSFCDDKLGRSVFSKQLANTIMQFKTKDNYTISLQGKWGSGKTFVVNMVIEEIMYELPIGSIREIIANAVTHRSYLEPGNVQVALYDNRLEVTSPGMLLNGVTIEKIKEGYSKVRNRAIANAFSYMRIIEEWGSGIPRMFDEFSKYGLAEPELVDMDGDFRVNFYRSSVTPRVTEKVTEKFTEREMSVIRLIKNNPRITTTAMSMELGRSRKTISAIIKSLKDRNVIEREGSDRNGIWIIK